MKHFTSRLTLSEIGVGIACPSQAISFLYFTTQILLYICPVLKKDTFLASKMKAIIALANGEQWQGSFFGYQGETSGEVVFNTAMTGYPESLSDPSYYGQILVLTYPIIGNYGIPKGGIFERKVLEFFESAKPHIRGLVVDTYIDEYSHWNAEKSLSTWLEEHKIVGIHGVDTREITKQLREHGNMLGAIHPAEIPTQKSVWYDPQKENVVSHVSCKEKIIYEGGEKRVVLIDCGTKNNIIRNLLSRGLTVIRVPYDYDYTSETYDAVFVSNGPGNPQHLQSTIQHLQKSMADDKVLYGICLGCQLIALAVGAKVFKLKFGHRSHNQPVIQTTTNKCYITSQNHGYAVDKDTLPNDFFVSYLNLNDHTCEGVEHKNKPISAVQFHPEAFGGPEDTAFFFDQFVSAIYANQ